ncbi:MAG TPA: amino acid permease [Victivallales bacterium]|nr:amino acid permease [Victivallales bacterium]
MELKRDLKFIPILSITMGSMISSGIFILPAAAFALSGPSILESYFIGGICAIIGSMSMVELTTAMPKAGGIYYFTSRSLGGMVGTLSGLLLWIAIAMKAAFAIYGISLLVASYTGINFFIIGLVITLFYMALNIKGVKEAAKFDVILVGAIILIMIPFTILGYGKIDLHNFIPFMPKNGSFSMIIATTAFVFISFGGVMNAANVSEEMVNPKRDIPLAVFTAIVVVMIIYSVILSITIGVLPGPQFIKSINPIADAGKIIFGNIGYIIITIAACLAFSSCANSGIMSSSRYPMALSRDGLAPKIFGKLNSRTKTPIVSIVATAVLILLALTLDLNTLVHAASTVILTSYILTDASVLVLRFSKINSYRPSFKVPFFPVIQIISICIFTSLICYMGAEAIKMSLGLIFISFIIYLFYAKKNKTKYALLHIVEQITNKEMTSDHLEDELKEIIHNRDEIKKDNFDKLIDDAVALDLQGPLVLEDFLNTISEKLEPVVNIKKERLSRLFLEREKDSSTVLMPTVAIPHIVVDKEDCFELLVARCKEGIKFSEKDENVKAVIALIGSRNNRNLHLKALAAIAQVIQDDEFDKLWEKALTPNTLKDIFLLGKRKRVH